MSFAGINRRPDTTWKGDSAGIATAFLWSMKLTKLSKLPIKNKF